MSYPCRGLIPSPLPVYWVIRLTDGRPWLWLLLWLACLFETVVRHPGLLMAAAYTVILAVVASGLHLGMHPRLGGRCAAMELAADVCTVGALRWAIAKNDGKLHWTNERASDDTQYLLPAVVEVACSQTWFDRGFQAVRYLLVEAKASARHCRSLIIAAGANRADLVELLLAHGADPNPEASDSMQSPLMLAVAVGANEAVASLLARKASPTAIGYFPLVRPDGKRVSPLQKGTVLDQVCMLQRIEDPAARERHGAVIALIVGQASASPPPPPPPVD